MGWLSSLFGNQGTVKSPADRWLDRAEAAVDQIRNKPQAAGLVTVNRDMACAMGAAAFVGCAFAVTMFTDPGSSRYKNFMESVRETAVTRYGECFRSYLRQCGHFTADCNSVIDLCKNGYGSLADRLIPALMVLNCAWLVEALGGNPGAAYRLVPAITQKTMFGATMHDQFESMINAFNDLS